MRMDARIAALAAALLGLVAATAVASQRSFVAAGDSLTAGVGDPEGKGYPRRLEILLRRELGDDVVVTNLGLLSDDTAGLLSRIDTLWDDDDDVVLLMVGTNDVTQMADGEMAPEATAFNITELGRRIQKAGLEPVHATVVPRPRYAFRDQRNFFTRRLAWDVRELAAARKRRLVDAYQVFDPAQMFNPTPLYYTPQFDAETGERDFVGHLNPTGYDKLAQAFADVLLGTDTVPPVIGSFTPGLVGATDLEVPPDQEFRIPLFEFTGSTGFDVANTRLTINGVAVGRIEGRAKSGRIELVHDGLDGLGCLAELGVRAQDRADPPNVIDYSLEIYTVEGREINAGDVDFNCVVEQADIDEFAKSFGRVKGEKGFSDLVDFVNDDRIDGHDFAVLAKNFGKSSL